VKRTSQGRHELRFVEPVDFTNMATVCLMSPMFPHLKATASFRECDTDALLIECIQIEIVDVTTGELADCEFDPTGVQGYNVIFGPAPTFSTIINT
jgi:hypothetical protein